MKRWLMKYLKWRILYEINGICLSYDLVIALDDKNVDDLRKLGATKVVKLGAYGYQSQNVPDPYFFDGFEGFEKVFEMIDACVCNLFEKYGLL